MRTDIDASALLGRGAGPGAFARWLLLAIVLWPLVGCVSNAEQVPESAPKSAQDRQIEQCVALLRDVDLWCRAGRLDSSLGSAGQGLSTLDCLEARLRLKQKCY